MVELLNILIAFITLVGLYLLLAGLLNRDLNSKPIYKFILNLLALPLYIAYWFFNENYLIYMKLKVRWLSNSPMRHDEKHYTGKALETTLEKNRTHTKTAFIDKLATDELYVYFLIGIYLLGVLYLLKPYW